MVPASSVRSGLLQEIRQLVPVKEVGAGVSLSVSLNVVAGWLVGWLNLLNAELSQSEEVLARTEMPGGRGKRETIPNTTLSPPGRLLH